MHEAMSQTGTHAGSQLMIACIIVAVVSSACRKDDQAESEGPYTEQIIYSETFDEQGSWNSIPDGIFDPDTSLVGIADGQLQLTFDHSQFGAAWLGAEVDLPNIQEDSILSRLGIRVKLAQGYFQGLTQWHDTVVSGLPSQIGTSASTSRLRLSFNDIEMTLPDPTFGRTHRDSTFDADAFKIEGQEFELIADRGTRIFRVDGVDHALSEVYFNVNGMSNHPLNIEFTLGHNTALDPRIDHLFVDKIEIYTWSGERPN